MTVLASRWLAISIHAKSGCCTTSWRDRKSTRLNSSHSQISYAVFCLKKKKNHIPPHHALTNPPSLSMRHSALCLCGLITCPSLPIYPSHFFTLTLIYHYPPPPVVHPL